MFDDAQGFRHGGPAGAPTRSSWLPVRSRTLILGIGLIIALWYTLHYLGNPNLPGNQPAHPLGWWGWFDQSMTLRSTVALARANLNPDQHHYPLGYALLGLPLFSAAKNHPFFFVDLVSLLAAFAGFISLARRLALPGALAAVLFAVATVGDGAVFQQWVVPWNTTPVGAGLWLLLASCAAWFDGRRRPWQIGLLAGGIMVCRPSDAVAILPCMLALVWAERGNLSRRLGDAARLAGGAMLMVLPVVALHLAIYGPAQSLYMENSARIGFTLYDLGWKAYVLFVDPYPWFADGEGLLQHAHWIALGLAGLVPALLRGPKDRLVALVLTAHGVLYVSYVDLLPTGLWRFNNVHYFVWAIPGYALLAALLLRDLALPGRPRRVAAASLVATSLVLCLRVVPRPAAAGEPAKAIDFAGPLPPFTDIFFGGKLALRDSEGVLLDGHDIRGFLYPGGVRVIGMRRDLVGPVAWLPDTAPQGFAGTTPAARWTQSVKLAWPPRWLHRASAPGIPVPVK